MACTCDTIRQLRNELSYYQNSNFDRVEEQLKLCRHLRRVEEDRDKLLKENEDLVRALEGSKGDLESEMATQLEERGEDGCALCSQCQKDPSQLSPVDDSLKEDNDKLLEDKEKLSNQVRALETKQEHLDSELQHQDQRLRDMEEMVRALSKSQQGEREETEPKLQQRDDNINELTYALGHQAEFQDEYIEDCVNNTHGLQLEVDTLTSELDLKKTECENLQKELQELKGDLTIAKTSLEKSLDTLEKSLDELEKSKAEEKSTKAELERTMLMKVEEAAEQKSSLQSAFEQKVNELTSQVSSLKEDNDKLLEDKEQLSNQVSALETKQQLDSGFHEDHQQLRDMEEKVQALVNTLQLEREETERKVQQKDDKINELTYALGHQAELHDEYIEDCVNNTHELELEVDTLTSDLDLKETECENLKKELQELKGDVTITKTSLEKSLDTLEKSLDQLEESKAEEKRTKAELERTMLITVEEAAEQKSSLQSAFEQKVNELISQVSSLKEDNDKLLEDKEQLSNQVRVLETKQQLDSALQDKDQRLRDMEEKVRALEKSQQVEREENENKLQERAEQIGELLHAFRNQVEKYREHMGDCEKNTQDLQLEVFALKSALDLKEIECGDLKTELKEKGDDVTTVKTNLEKSLDRLDWSLDQLEKSKAEEKRTKAELERTMLMKLEEAAEQKSSLQSAFEQKVNELISQVSSLKEDNDKLLEDKEQLSNQVSALETKQQLDSGFHEDHQQLRDMEEKVQALVNTLQLEREETERKVQQRDDKINELTYALGHQAELHDEFTEDCVNNTHELELEVDTLTSDLDLKETECENLKKELQKLKGEVSIAKTNLEKSLDGLEWSLDQLEKSKAEEKRTKAEQERTMLMKVEEAAEQKSSLQSAFEQKVNELISQVSSLKEDNDKLLEDKEQLSNQVSALETKQQLDSGFHEDHQQLRDMEEKVQALVNTLQLEREETERKVQQRDDKINELTYALGHQAELHDEYIEDCVNNTHELELEVDTLTSDLDLKETECENLKKELQKLKGEVSIARTNLEKSLDGLEWSLDQLEKSKAEEKRTKAEQERTMLMKVEEAAEQKSSLQSAFEQKVNELISQVSSLKEDNNKLLEDKEQLSNQVRVLETKQQLDSGFHEDHQQLRDMEEEVQALVSSLQLEREETERMVQERDVLISELLDAFCNREEKYSDHPGDCEKNTQDRQLEVFALKSALDRKEIECENLKKEVKEKGDDVATVSTNLETFLDELEEFKAEEERRMGMKLQEAAAVIQATYWNIVVMREQSRKAKLSACRPHDIPALTYGQEGLVMTDIMRSWLQEAQMSFLRRLADFDLDDRVLNSAIPEGLSVQPPFSYNERSQLRSSGLLAKTPPGGLSLVVYQARPSGLRPQGWPRTRRGDYIFGLIRERLSVPPEELRVIIVSPLFTLLPPPQTDEVGKKTDGWMDGSVRVMESKQEELYSELIGAERLESPSAAVAEQADERTGVRLMKVVCGSFHQGYQGFKYGGVQCMAIAAVSLAKHTMNSVFSWETCDLDHAVVLGDALYTNLRDNHIFTHPSCLMSVPDLPEQLEIDEQLIDFAPGDSVFGDVGVTEGEFIDEGLFISLRNGLERIFSQYTTCLMTMCAHTSAIVCEAGRFAVVDSHSRSDLGLVHDDGTSVVLQFACLDDLHQYICCLADCLSSGEKFFELCGVSIGTFCFIL